MRQGERSIQIVGENGLQNNLLCAYLQDSVGARCLCMKTVEGIARIQGSEGEHLVLIDCFSLQKDGAVALIESSCLSKLAERRLTLFNLRANSSIERTALRCGIRGFFYLEDSLATITKGILALFNDEYWVSRKLLIDFFTTPNQAAGVATHFPGLTLRESELIALLIKGLSNQAIADLLFISIPTVKSHLSSIYRKIQVSSRLQAVRWAERSC